MVQSFRMNFLKAVELQHEIERIDGLTDIEKKATDEGISDVDSGKLYLKPTG